MSSCARMSEGSSSNWLPEVVDTYVSCDVAVPTV